MLITRAPAITDQVFTKGEFDVILDPRQCMHLQSRLQSVANADPGATSSFHTRAAKVLNISELERIRPRSPHHNRQKDFEPNEPTWSTVHLMIEKVEILSIPEVLASVRLVRVDRAKPAVQRTVRIHEQTPSAA
jgi:hypothetical protein